MMAMPRRGNYAVLTLVCLTLVGLIGFTVLRKKERRHRPRIADYTCDVKPILEARCYACHGPKRQKGGLRLDTVAAIRKGSDNSTVIVPGNAARSLLIAAVTGAEDSLRMPPTGPPLSEKEIAYLRAWINNGARAPEESEQELAGPVHWAFRPPVRPAVPGIRSGERCNPIDAFLAAERYRKKLTASPPADRGLLFRRVSIGLIGLPPAPEELRAFLADSSEDAYEKAVERLLASPQYGERWGRHWMDVWRYSDPDGRKAKKDVWWSNEHIWRWRDWIIASLNADKGYGRMILEMLAGDEAAPNDPDALAATGFLVRNWFKLNRNIWLNNTVEHTAKAFLGLTLNCARCHDHKFDPISQKEYYQFRAFFQPHDVRTDPLAGAGKKEAIARVYDAHPDEPTRILIRGDEKTPDQKTPIAPGVPAALGNTAIPINPVQVAAARNGTSTGRRLALARWLCEPRNPLTARVAVNHIWARHFGRPLAENAADFGVRPKPPAHQALLDWLSVEFMARDWSMKWLHRLLVTSAAYRMQSSSVGATEANLAADPENRYYWRMNSRRMEAEVVRDSLLLLAGEMEQTMGGPPLDALAGPHFARRSLYHRYSREDRMEFLTAFDAAGVEECYRRQESIVPQQAFALQNSEFAWDQARRIARRLGSIPAREFVAAAFECLLGRAPSPAEREACASFLVEQQRLLSDPRRLTPFPERTPMPKGPETPTLPLTFGTARTLPRVSPAADPEGQARECLIHALLNHNDFIVVR